MCVIGAKEAKLREEQEQRERKEREVNAAANANPTFANVKGKTFLGIRWFKTDGEIDRLNTLVDNKVAKFVADSTKNGTPLSPEVAALLERTVDGSSNRNATKVYQNRFTWGPIFYTLLAAGFLVFHAPMRPITALVAFVLSFLWYDMFSGILHVVLDNPDFINFPILSAPCLEFQWHHHIPLVGICAVWLFLFLF